MLPAHKVSKLARKFQVARSQKQGDFGLGRYVCVVGEYMGRIVRKMQVRNGCHRVCRVTPPFADGEAMGLIEDGMRLVSAVRLSRLGTTRMGVVDSSGWMV